jgi:hypothetical protein
LFFSTSRDGFMLVVAWALSWWFIHLVIFYLQLLLEGWVCFSYCFDHDRNMIIYIYIYIYSKKCILRFDEILD